MLREFIKTLHKSTKRKYLHRMLNEKAKCMKIAKNFSQISPNNGTPERQHQKTEVKICYDSKNINFGVMMYDNAPDSILQELSKRDEENKILS